MIGARRAAALSVHFEAGDLFVLAHVEGFGSFGEARRALASGLSLSFGGWISVVCPGSAPRRLCPYDNDECGRWPAGADRSSHDDGRAAQLSIPAFMACGPDAALFRPTWAAAMDWEAGADGRFDRVIASASGSIDTLAPG